MYSLCFFYKVVFSLNSTVRMHSGRRYRSKLNKDLEFQHEQDRETMGYWERNDMQFNFAVGKSTIPRDDLEHLVPQLLLRSMVERLLKHVTNYFMNIISPFQAFVIL